MEKIIDTFREKLYAILPPALLILLNIFLFGPAQVYQINRSEFSFNFVEIAHYYALPLFAVLLIIVLTASLMRQKQIKILASVLFALGLLLWIQGNIIVWDYGIFGGDEIEWNLYHQRGWVDVSLWSLLLIISCIFYRNISKVSALFCVVLICLQGIILTATYISSPGKMSSEVFQAERPHPPEGLYHYSETYNIVHIIMDTFQSDIFEEVVKGNNFGHDLDGFIFFRENIGVAERTFIAIPAIFSGETYQGSLGTEASSYINESMSEKGFPHHLFNNGYEVNLIHQSLIPSISFPPKNYSNHYMIPNVYGGTERDRYFNEAATLLDLVLFRSLPHPLKKRIYNNQGWLVQRMATDKKLGYFHYKDFFRDYIDRLQVRDSRPAYHFMHLIPPHPPATTSENCEYAGRIFPTNRETYVVEGKCMLKLFINFIEKLKTLGIYDSSLIILQADTGKGFPPHGIRNAEQAGQHMLRTIGQSMATLAIKPPHKRGELVISDEKTMNSDVAATIMSIVGLPHNFNGTSVFAMESSDERERWFDSSLKVSGSVFDYQSWQVVENKSIAKRPEAIPYRWGTLIQFGLLGSAESYQTKGWSYLEGGFTWTVSNNAILNIPLAAAPESPVNLRANLRAFLYPGKINSQSVNILINGTKIDNWLITDPGFQEYSLTIPAKYIAGTEKLTINFNIPHLTKPSTVGYHHDRRSLGVALKSIKLYELTPYVWGSDIQFGKEGNALPYQKGGWSTPENGFTWTEGRSASLNIPIDSVPGTALKLRSTFRTFLLPGKLNAQRVHISINGMSAGKWVITKQDFQEQTLIIPQSMLKNTDSIMIDFHTPDASSPSKTGLSNDKRMLGIALRTLSLEKPGDHNTD